MKETFIKSRVIDLGINAIYYYHFVGESAVKQLEITKTRICMKTKPSLVITDVCLSDFAFSPENFISSEEFNNAWYSPEEVQNKLFYGNVIKHNFDNEEKFIKKRYVEEHKGIDKVCYIHFIGKSAVRQLEISENEIYMITDASSLLIKDKDLYERALLTENFITAEEFNKAWNFPEMEQNSLFGNNALPYKTLALENYIGFGFVEFGKSVAAYYHFVGEYAVRQLEITKDSIYMMKNQSSKKIKLIGNSLSKMIDGTSLKASNTSFSNVELAPQFYMTTEEFNKVWNAPLALQDRLLGKSINSPFEEQENTLDYHTKKCEFSDEEVFIKKRLVISHRNTIGYYHFVGNYVVRQLEISKNEIYLMRDKPTLKLKKDGEIISKIIDVSSQKIREKSFYDVVILPEDFITAEEFNKVWISPEEEQKHLFGNDAS